MIAKELTPLLRGGYAPDPLRLGDLTERATHALRNSIGNMVALAYVLEDSGADREALGEMLRNIGLVALDAELLADLALLANAPEQSDAPLRVLLGDAVRPFEWFTWLAGSESGSIQVDAPPELEASFARPGEIISAGRRLVASVIGRSRPPAVILEASSVPGGVLLVARDARLDSAELPPEVAAEPGSGGNYLDLEVLALSLRRPGLDARLYLADDGRCAAARLVEI